MNIAIYTRVSTNDKGQDTTNQLLQLQAFAKLQGWVVVMEYSDEVTGKHGDRAGFTQMLRDAAHHRFDCLLFWSLDRLTREGTLPTLQYLQRLTDSGVRYKSYTEQYIDSLGVFGDAIIGVLAAVSKQERVRMSERVKAGMSRAKAQGTHCGRPRVEINMAMIQTRINSGESLCSVARSLGVSPALLCKRQAEA